MKVCFIGHRKIDNVDELTAKLYDTVYELIANGADTFLFGSKSEFNSACWNTVSALKQQYSFIERVYVRAEYPVIDQSYTSYLLQYYEKTFYPPELIRAGRSIYIKRNRAMIDASDICIFYYNPEYTPPDKKRKKYSSLLPDIKHKSGTAIAFTYAQQTHKQIINLYKD